VRQQYFALEVKKRRKGETARERRWGWWKAASEIQPQSDTTSGASAPQTFNPKPGTVCVDGFQCLNFTEELEASGCFPRTAPLQNYTSEFRVQKTSCVPTWEPRDMVQ
ncbi:hypothetical protein U0070_024484, partial [Myodes glareolus]